MLRYLQVDLCFARDHGSNTSHLKFALLLQTVGVKNLTRIPALAIFSLTVMYFITQNSYLTQSNQSSQPTLRHISSTHNVKLSWIVFPVNLDKL